jgi:acyl-CoA thioester hydrolase
MIFTTLWRSKTKVEDKKADIINQLDSFKYKTDIETRFADFDMMGHVNNAHYFTYMEIGRTKYWKQAINWNWRTTGVVIAKASLDYILPILLEDKVIMYIRTSRIGNTSFHLEYLIVKLVNGEEVVCSKGETVCVAYDYKSGSPTSIPKQEKEKMMLFEQLTAV